MDFEASSINGYPIQFAYGSSEEDLKCHLIKPLPVWDKADYMWDYNAEDIHGFSKNYLHEYGVNAATVAREICEDLKGKTVYSDHGADHNWFLMLIDDVAEMTGEEYPIPKFGLLRSLSREHRVDPYISIKAQIMAQNKFRERGLVYHKADNDTLMHIWTWEFIQELSEKEKLK